MSGVVLAEADVVVDSDGNHISVEDRGSELEEALGFAQLGVGTLAGPGGTRLGSDAWTPRKAETDYTMRNQ